MLPVQIATVLALSTIFIAKDNIETTKNLSFVGITVLKENIKKQKKVNDKTYVFNKVSSLEKASSYQ